jgi:hypothetical protein
MPVLRRRPAIYLTTGHGELNDTTGRRLSDAELGGASALRDLLGYLGYDPRELGLTAGSGNEVPFEAAAVLVIGPRRPFLAQEITALERYLDRGGSLLLALDPGSDFELGPLEERIGVRFVPTPLADEDQHLRQRGDLSDRRLLITDRFVTHESVITLARSGPGTGVAMVGPGYVEALDPDADEARIVVRSLDTSFPDANQNYRWDEGSESREAYPLVAAVEVQGATLDSTSAAAGVVSKLLAGGDTTIPLGETTPRTAVDGSARVLVFASSSPFTDALLVSLANNAALVSDGVRWLVGEEGMAGAIASEEDVPIVHTQEENVIWFHATILGAPALVLALGLFGVQKRRKRKGGRA